MYLRVVSLANGLYSNAFRRVVCIFIVFLDRRIDCEGLNCCLRDLRDDVLRLAYAVVSILRADGYCGVTCLRTLLLRITLNARVMGMYFTDDVLSVTVAGFDVDGLNGSADRAVGNEADLYLIRIDGQTLSSEARLVGYDDGDETLLASNEDRASTKEADAAYVNVNVRYGLDLYAANGSALGERPTLVDLESVGDCTFALRNRDGLRILADLVRNVLVRFFGLSRELNVTRGNGILRLEDALMDLS